MSGYDTVIQEKFTGVDVIRMLEGIVERNTTHYQSDFEYDRRILTDALSKRDREERIFLWLCRRMGTWCLREHDVYIRDTREHITYCHYAEERDTSVLCYAVEVRGSAGGKVLGDVYALDYPAHAAYVARNAVALGSTRRIYERQEYGGRPGGGDTAGCGRGKLLAVEYREALPDTLSALLRTERNRRSRFSEGCAEEHLWALWARVQQ